MAFHYWIQKHDYSSDEVTDVSGAQAVAAWETFDWAAELAAVDESDEGQNCPPGFGLHNGYDNKSNPERALLHVCPTDAEFAFANHHHMVEGKFLGLFTSRREQIDYIERLPRSEVPELIRLFCAERHADLVQGLQQYRPQET
ncbi:MAG: hypothetical protein QNI94_17875 [Kiloniellales bacterium]|nr:hypothetical protein [Kiloniellales bacterium]